MSQTKRMKALIPRLVAVIDDFLPNVGRCALQNYGELNSSLVDARALMREFEKPAQAGDALSLMRAEFKAASELAKRYKELPAVVDDDYPEARHYYDSAARAFIAAWQANRGDL